MRSERLKGHLDLLLLSVLSRGPGHGYEVITRLRDRSDGAFELPEGTVYPALHRLEEAGLLASAWDVVSGRRRRIYRLTPAGEAALAAAVAGSGGEFSGSMARVLGAHAAVLAAAAGPAGSDGMSRGTAGHAGDPVEDYLDRLLVTLERQPAPGAAHPGRGGGAPARRGRRGRRRRSGRAGSAGAGGGADGPGARGHRPPGRRSARPSRALARRLALTAALVGGAGFLAIGAAGLIARLLLRR